jgi:hypothetical protein
MCLCASAAAQEGYYGVGHDKWHRGFYSTLKRNDGGLVLQLMDCRPTQSRKPGAVAGAEDPNAFRLGKLTELAETGLRGRKISL